MKAFWPALVLCGKNTKGNTMKLYTDVADELARRQANAYTPPSIPQVKQTPVEIPGVMYQARELYQPVVSQPNQDKK